jgi:hypothetical protein
LRIARRRRRWQAHAYLARQWQRDGVQPQLHLDRFVRRQAARKLDETQPIQEYASFDLVQANMPITRDIGQSAVRLGAGETKIYSSSAMVNQVFAFDPMTSMTTPLSLSGSGIHVTGLASQRGQLAILDGISSDQFIYSFDAETGASLGKVVAATQVTRLHGLSNACRLPAFE